MMRLNDRNDAPSRGRIRSMKLGSWVASVTLLSASLVCAAIGCNSTTAAPDASIGGDSNGNYCTQVPGYMCSAAPCGVTYTNIQDLNCSGGEYCCAPNVDASFQDDATFDAGHFPDALPDTGMDGSPTDASHDATGHDSGHDAGHPDDAAKDAPTDHSVPDVADAEHG